MAVDLERLVTVSGVRVEFTEPGPHRFVVEASRDRDTWTEIAAPVHASPSDASTRHDLEATETVVLQVRVRLLHPHDDADEAPGIVALSVLGRL